jgi:DNA repair protein RadC
VGTNELKSDNELIDPSGDPSPSEADSRLTRKITEAARLLQIHFLDHVIVGSQIDGRSPYFSFKESFS